MLAQLLQEIHSGGTFEVNSLAARYNVSPAMVTAMLEHLQQAGLIQSYAACTDSCNGCSLRSSCSPAQKAQGVRLWKSAG